MFQQNPEFKKKLLMVVAVACGVLGSLLIYSAWTQEKAKLAKEIERVKQEEEAAKAAREKKKIAILVAARPIAAGVPISADDLVIQEIPAEYKQPGAMNPSDEIMGKTALSPISQGEQILKNKLGAPPEKSKTITEMTPKGKRAVPVAVDNIASLAGLIQPGDYVDALAIITPPPGSNIYTIVNRSAGLEDSKNEQKAVTLPLFQHVQILAIGADTGGPRGMSRGGANTVTLSLTPQESALASFILEQGKIRLVMRSETDVAQPEVAPVNWNNLFEYLYPKAREEGKLPATVEIYRGLQKEVVPLSEGKKK
jgi:Flp pilus assembly protein CpaB